MAADNVVDVGCFQAGLPVLGREIAAPDHGQGGMEFLDATAGGTASLSCGPGITVTPRTVAPVSRIARQRGDWVAFQVTIDNQVVMLALKQAPRARSDMGSTGLRWALLGGL